ncbi:hypothetical protein [Actinocorallia longicatena]|uniref:Uncharacterized protein n=1 Tax=Actinocorallia longicatena TaxID=111803 RepID=A0ABP6QAF9_9ACTN
MTKNKPVPGAEDLYPHLSALHAPGNVLDGEVVCSPRVLGLLLAPSVEEFERVWSQRQGAIVTGLCAGRFDYPREWEQGAKRRTKELQARYGTDDMVGILRGLHAEYGVLPTGASA